LSFQLITRRTIHFWGYPKPKLDSRADGGKRLKDKVCIVTGAGKASAGPRRIAWVRNVPRS